ncbi:MAG TPA: hypothetical protein VF463_06490 [Sphingobium sp.]
MAQQTGDGGGRTAPWGWWLTAQRDGFVDDDDRRWSSVRDAFWQGRLKFPPAHFADEHHELLLRVLTSLDNRLVGEVEGRHDLFLGDMMFWRFYMCWLVSIGLTEEPGHRSTALESGLTAEGRSVMMMLHATRDPDWVDLPMSDVIDAARASGWDEAHAAREGALKGFEAEAVHLPWVFSRHRVGESFLVKLTGIARDARMPTRRVIWTQSFSDEKVRDDFFAWLASRVERWEDFGGLAYRRGADALTAHLFALFVAAPLAGDV